MNLTSIILIIISAIIHASWNLLLKKAGNKNISFIVLIAFFSAVYSLPIIVFLSKYVFMFFPKIWPYLILTGLFQSIYFVSLNKSYQYGEISYAYPLVRALPIIFVVIFTTIFSLGKALIFPSILGMILIIIGCFLLPMKNYKDLKLSNYLNFLGLFSLIAAAGTAGYSLTDKHCTNILASFSSKTDLLLKSILCYAALEFVFTFLWAFIIIIFKNEIRNNLISDIKARKKFAMLIALGSFSAYFLVLLSMPLVSNVSYVVAFRQLSIPIGAILGIIIFKENCSLNKIIGIMTLFCGLLLVALF